MTSECLQFKLEPFVWACQFAAHTYTGSPQDYKLSAQQCVQSMVWSSLPQVLQRVHSSSHSPDPCIFTEHTLPGL